MSEQIHEETNLTVKVVGGVIVTGAVMVALFDMGFTGMVFSVISGTGTYFVYNMVMDDIPKEIREKYQNKEIVGWETVKLQLAAACAAGAVIINPLIGIPLVCLALVLHFWLVWQREKELYPLYKGLEELQRMYGSSPVARKSHSEASEGVGPEIPAEAEPAPSI